MKQTNNALKYLLAQYRAIFKHAYVKGLATAVIVTAGLAAGQAQAATPDSANNYYQYINGSWRETAKVPGNTEQNSVIVTGALAGDAITVSGDGSADEAKANNIASGGNIYLGSGDGLPTPVATSLASGAAAGGWAQATGNAIATGNRLTVQGNGQALKGSQNGRGILYGARANSTAGIAIAENNKLIINKGASAGTIAFDDAAIGGQAKGHFGARANNNLVDIDGSDELQQAISNSGGNLIGGQAADDAAGATGDFIVSGNTVDINQATYKAESGKTLQVFGGQAALTADSDANSLRAIGNSVILNNVNFDNASGTAMNIIGNYAEVGSTGSADTVRAEGIAGKLSIDIKNSTLNKAVVLGGRAVNSGSASASNLSVSIADTSFLGSNSLVGAASVESNYSGETVSSFANNNSLILSNSKPTTNTYSLTDGQILGATVALSSGSANADFTGSALSASNNTVEITGYTLIDTAINGALITQSNGSGATVTMDSNRVVFDGTLGTDDGSSSIRAAYGAGGLGRLTNNTLEINGTVNNAEIVAAQLNKSSYTLKTGEQHVLTGNAITIGSDAVINGGTIRAVFGDLDTSIATNNDVTISGQVKNVTAITGGAGAESVVDLQSSSRYDLTNTTGTIASDVVNLAGTMVIGTGASLTVKGYNTDGKSDGATSFNPNNTTIASSAKIYNTGTINLNGNTVVDDAATLEATANKAKLVLNASGAAVKADKDSKVFTDFVTGTENTAKLTISSANVKSYLSGDGTTQLTIAEDETAYDNAGIIEVISGGHLAFNDQNAVVLSDFNFFSGANDIAGAIKVEENTTNGGSIFSADTLTVEHQFAQNGEAYAKDPENTTLSGITGQGIILQANTLNLGAADLDSSESAKIQFAKATIKDEINFSALTSGEDEAGNDNDGYHLTSQVIGSNFMLTNDQNAAGQYYTALNGNIHGTVTITASTPDSGELAIVDGNWTAHDNITLASGGTLAVGATSDGSGSQAKDILGVNDPDATLVLNQDLVLNVASGDVTVKVSGSGTHNNTWQVGGYAEHFDSNVDYPNNHRVALLDLRSGLTMQGTVSGNTQTYNHKASFDVSNGGIVLLNASDVNDILAQNDTVTTKTGSGAFFKASNGGAFVVTGDLTADFDDFSTGATINNGFDLGTSNGYLVADSLTVESDRTKGLTTATDENGYTFKEVNFGGTVVVDNLAINDLQVTNGESKPANVGTYASHVTMANGTAIIGQSLSSVNNTLILGTSETGDTATLVLEHDLFDGDGSVNAANIRVDNGAVLVTNGVWDASSTTFNLNGNAAQMSIGSGSYLQDEDEEDIEATLKAQGLTMGAGSSLVVYSNGDASFNRANLSALTAQAAINGGSRYTGITVYGDLTINGDASVTDANGDGTADTLNGVAFGAEGSIVIANNGNLTFGEAATNGAIIANGTYNGAQAVTDAIVDGYTKIQNNGGELYLSLNNTVFDADAIKQLKSELFTAGSMTNGVLNYGGVLNIGNASFHGITVDELVGPGLSGYTATWADLREFSDVYGVDVVNNELAQTNVSAIAVGDQVQGHWGSLSMASTATDPNAQVLIAGNTSLRYAAGNAGYFISNATHSAALGANVQSQKTLELIGGGQIGKVTLQDGLDDVEKNLTTLKVTGEGETTINSINGTGGISSNRSDTRVWVDGANNVTTVTGDITGVGYVEASNGASLTAANVDVHELATTNADLSVTNTAKFDNIFILGGTASAKEAIFNSINGNDEADDAVIANGGTFTAETFIFRDQDNGILNVGLDIPAEQAFLDDGTPITGTGYFEAGILELNGGTLMVDPDYGEATSVAAVGKFRLNPNSTFTYNSAGIIEGRVLVGKNAALGIGATLEETRAAIAQYQSNGSLSADEYGSILYLNGQLSLDPDSEIALNAAQTASSVEGIRSSLLYTRTAQQLDQEADLGLGANTAILMTEKAFEDANGEKTGTAIYFQKQNAKVNANGGEIVLVGAFDTAQKLNFFNDQDNNGIDIVQADGTDGSIRVYTQNGFLFTTLTGQNAGYGEYLQVDRDHAYATMYEASDPVVETLIAYHTDRLPAEATNGSSSDAGNNAGNSDTPANGGASGGANSANNGAVVNTTPNAQSTTPSEQLLADNSSNAGRAGAIVGVGGANGSDTPTDTPADTPSDTPADTPSNNNPDAGQDNTTNDTQVATTRGNSKFLDEVVTTSHGAPAEAAARLAIYGGTAQAALGASSSTTDAIAARLGVGSAAGLTIANNGQGAALWLAPVYKSHDSDGFDSQGLDYGVDLNLYGVALGADLEIIPGFTAGLMFNVGSGDVDGQGNSAANNTSNDFDYWGAALYGSYRYDALTVAADISYTTVDNDLEATTGMAQYGKLESSADSTALSFGVTAKYAFDFNTVEVAPHAGLRYTNIDLDDYTVTSNGEDVAHFDAGSISVFSIPVGVTVAKEFQGDNWSVKPMFDLTLTGNFGDDEVDGTVSWTGVDNLTTGVSSEFLDNFTYGATLGVEAKTGSFSFGLGVNYTGSSNADEYGVNANARFVF